MLILKSSAYIFQVRQSSPSLTILVSLWFIIVSLMLFYLCKLLFSGFLQFKGNFVLGQYKNITQEQLRTEDYQEEKKLTYATVKKERQQKYF